MDRSSPDSSRPPVTLCSHDADALDQILDGQRTDAPPPHGLALTSHPIDDAHPQHPQEQHSKEQRPHDERTETMKRLLITLASCPAATPRADLMSRTLERINNIKQQRRFAEQIQTLSGPRPGFNWSELTAVAAIILIGVSLIWPMLARTRSEARRIACANNLAVAGQAIGRYAADHNNTLPRGRVKSGSGWWSIGSGPTADGYERSNSAHLYVLVKSKYVTAHTLCCPDNPSAPAHMDESMHDWPSHASISFSYQNQHTAHPIRLDQRVNLAILADRNPLFEFGSNGVVFRPGNIPVNSPSKAHGRLGGQNILTSNGAVTWSGSPVLPTGDNIWLIRNIDQYSGSEAPKDPDDSFLVP